MAISGSDFIEESIKHPDWLRVVEGGDSAAILRLAKSQSFEGSLEDLKQAAAMLLKGSGSSNAAPVQPSSAEVSEAASGLSDLDEEAGYGDDTGYAALYGVAGAILKLA